MRLQTKALLLSAAVHAALFAGIVGAGALVPQGRLLMFDFGIAAETGGSGQRQRPVFPRPESDSKRAVRTAPLPRDHAAGTTVPTPDPESEGSGRSAEGQSASPASASGDGPGESAEAAYVKQHFASIRECILRGLTYPALARRKGWEGTVTVSFIVGEDGRVEGVKVVESSGVDVLDRNAVEAIRKTGSFPKPPMRAEFVMPIVYRLE